MATHPSLSSHAPGPLVPGQLHLGGRAVNHDKARGLTSLGTCRHQRARGLEAQVEQTSVVGKGVCLQIYREFAPLPMLGYPTRSFNLHRQNQHSAEFWLMHLARARKMMLRSCVLKQRVGDPRSVRDLQAHAYCMPYRPPPTTLSLKLRLGESVDRLGAAATRLANSGRSWRTRAWARNSQWAGAVCVR